MFSVLPFYERDPSPMNNQNSWSKKKDYATNSVSWKNPLQRGLIPTFIHTTHLHDIHMRFITSEVEVTDFTLCAQLCMKP